MKSDFSSEPPKFSILILGNNMNDFRDSLMVVSMEGPDGQHRNKTGVFCENASKRIKLENALRAIENKDHEKENRPSESEDGYEIPPHKNPFLFTPVLSVLFSHMDVETLKKARQVCHLWKNESLQIFKEKTEAVLNLEEICHASCAQRKINAEICQNFLRMSSDADDSELAFENLCINMIDMSCKGRMAKIFHIYGSQITSLNIMFCNPHSGLDEDDDYNLDFFFRERHFKLILLYWCMNLKSLKLFNLPFSIVETTKNIFAVTEYKNRQSYIPGGPLSTITDLIIEDEREYFPLGKMIIFHILKISPQISRLEIDVEDEEAFDSFIEGLALAKSEGLLKNLNSLIFGTRFGCIFYENHLISLIAMELDQLRRLEILNMGQDMTVESLNKLFLQCKDTLEVFRLDVTPVTDKTEFPSQILQIPIMKKLKHLEINFDKIQLSFRMNLIRNFPNLKTCILDTDCSCGYHFTGRYWNTMTLKCSKFTYFDHPFSKSMHSISTVQFKYKAHCVRIFERIRKWFPTVKSLYANKGEDRFGLVDLFRAISETNVEELYLEISCPKSNGTPCCSDQSVEQEETELEKLFEQTQTQVLTKVEKQDRSAQIFPDLWKLNIVSNGCRNMNIDILRQLGILSLMENAPALTDCTIKYCFQTSSKTAVIFDYKQPVFEAEQ